MDAVASRTANADLREQLIELRGARGGGMHAAQPVAQHIGLARWAQRLQCGDAGRVAHRTQVGLGHLLQELGRFGAMPAAARKGGAKLGKAWCNAGSNWARMRLRV